MSSRRTTLAVERIADEPRFAARFRHDPERALRPYRLTPTQIEAVKRGDAFSLAAEGVDTVAFAEGRRHGWRPRWRHLLACVAVLTGAVVGFAGPAGAARQTPRHGLRRAARRAELDLRRSGVRHGLRHAVRAGRHSPRMGVRAGLRHSGLRAGLRATGVRLDGGKDPCPCVEPAGSGKPFELGKH